MAYEINQTHKRAKEVYVDTLQDITTMRGLTHFKHNVCDCWCDRGSRYCDEHLCRFGREYREREKEVALLEEQREIRDKKLAIKIKDRLVTVKHREETKDCFTALKRSCTCAIKRETDSSRLEVLEKINKNIRKHNKQMISYYAKKYNFVNIIEILDRYGKKRIKGEKTDV